MTGGLAFGVDAQRRERRRTDAGVVDPEVRAEVCAQKSGQLIGSLFDGLPGRKPPIQPAYINLSAMMFSISCGP